MKTMAEKAGLNAENLTNHSARKRMIQKLNDHEVPPTHIMQISGHKNVQSLNNYSSLSEKQQRDISNIMSASTSASESLAIQETDGKPAIASASIISFPRGQHTRRNI